MAVVDDDAARLADAGRAKLGARGGVRGVPGGFVVGQDLDFVLAGDPGDGAGICRGNGEGLFDHGGDAEAGGNLNGGAVFSNGGVNEHRLGVGALDHGGLVGEVETFGERELCLVLGEEGGIGGGDSDQLDVGVAGKGGEEALDVAVFEANDGYAEGRGGLGGEASWDGEREKQAKETAEGGEAGHGGISPSRPILRPEGGRVDGVG